MKMIVTKFRFYIRLKTTFFNMLFIINAIKLFCYLLLRLIKKNLPVHIKLCLY
jgi:hypothetical protein